MLSRTESAAFGHPFQVCFILQLISFFRMFLKYYNLQEKSSNIFSSLFEQRQRKSHCFNFFGPKLEKTQLLQKQTRYLRKQNFMPLGIEFIHSFGSLFSFSKLLLTLRLIILWPQYGTRLTIQNFVYDLAENVWDQICSAMFYLEL